MPSLMTHLHHNLRALSQWLLYSYLATVAILGRLHLELKLNLPGLHSGSSVLNILFVRVPISPWRSNQSLWVNFRYSDAPCSFRPYCDEDQNIQDNLRLRQWIYTSTGSTWPGLSSRNFIASGLRSHFIPDAGSSLLPRFYILQDSYNWVVKWPYGLLLTSLMM